MDVSVQRRLFDVFQRLPPSRALGPLSAHVLDAVIDIFDAQWGGVVLRKADSTLDFQAGRTAAGQPVLQWELQVDHGLIDQIMASTAPLILATTHDDRPQAIIGIPLVTPAGAAPPFGALILVARDPATQIDGETGQFVRDYVGVVFENALLHERLTTEHTERERIADALHKREHVIDLALLGGDLGLWEVDLRTGQYTFNDHLFKIIGYGPGEISTDSGIWDRLIHPDDRSDPHEMWTAHLAGHTPHYQAEFRLQTKSGEWRTVLSRGKVVSYDDSGHPTRVSGTLLDVTRLRQAQLDLRDSEERFRTIVDHTVDGIMLVDQEGIVRFANPAAQRLFQRRAVDLVGMSFGLPLAESETEVDIVLDDGRVSTAEMWARMIRWQYETVYLVTLRDVTERKRAELSARQAHDRMMMMRVLDMELTRRLDVDYVLTIALDAAIRLCGAETGAVALFENGELMVTHAVGAYQREGTDSFRLDTGIVGRVLRSREPELVQDVSADPDYVAVIPETRAQMVMPIISQDQLLGVFSLETSQPDPFNQESFTFLRLMVGRVSMALDNARLFEAEQRRRRIEQMLRQVTRSLSETLELDEVFNRILRYLRQVIEFDTASVLQYNHDERILEIMACFGFDDPQRVIGITFDVKADDPLRRPLFDCQPLHIHDVVAYDDLFRVHGLEDLHVRSWLSVPLVLRDEVIGTVTLDRHEVKPFTEQEIDLAVVFASHAAIAMGNARSYQREQKRRFIEQTLRTSAELLNETLEISEVMDRIMLPIRAVVPCDTGSIQEVRGDALEIIACYGFAKPERVLGQRFSLQDNRIVREIADTLRPMHIANVDENPLMREYKRLHPNYQGKTWLGIPLVAHGKMIGQITLDRNQVSPYTADEIELASAFANHAAVALENARLFAAEQRQRQVEQTLRQAAQIISETLSLDEVFQRILNQLKQVIEFDSGSVQQVKDGELEIVCCAGFDDPHNFIGMRFPASPDSVFYPALAEKKPYQIENTHQHDEFDPHFLQGFTISSWLAVPLLARDEVIGMITLDRWQVRPYTQQEIDLVVTFANHAALAIENAELYRQQQNYAQNLIKSLSEREKLIEELDAFAHTVAHDLKNPLSLVIAYAEMLRAEPDDLLSDLAGEYIDELAYNAERMNGIIDALMVLAGVRQAEDVEIEELNMGPIVAEVQRRLDNVIRERDVELVLPEEWPVVVGYAPWVEEVWANYVSNAIKYGGDPPRVELGAQPHNGAIRFWVRDNGQGIAPEEFSQLFTPFTRLSRAKKVDGHGLGLSIVQRIVERLGGEVAVESELEHGSTFSFTLPVKKG